MERSVAVQGRSRGFDRSSCWRWLAGLRRSPLLRQRGSTIGAGRTRGAELDGTEGSHQPASPTFTGPCLVTSQLRQSSLRPFPLAVMPGARVTVGGGRLCPGVPVLQCAPCCLVLRVTFSPSQGIAKLVACSGERLLVSPEECTAVE
ncbi:hypothetical protein O3P69_015348 [Scylla paramamosain]|uniref:Uncharacterized protein n=1 Tax=Scylla paramamosain TaxID=85552 RepID=A0AAW0T3V3_SCYPA